MKILVVLKNPQIDIIADVDKSAIKNFIGFHDNGICEMNNVSVVQLFDKQPYPSFFPFNMCKDFSVDMPHQNISFMAECEESLAKIHTKEIEKAKEVKVKYTSKEEYERVLQQRKEQVNSLKK
jgi:hypothetical protein